ncbi:MAG: hypothetical protein KGS72_00165 [Cyanobacteria bacterium REEB67]|nr:hypothetical protein [Cyanobacteria bacterium REEB67]
MHQEEIWTPPSPVANQLYRGKVSTFFDGQRGWYCESYEAARVTAYGDISRIESRLISGRWRHQAFRYNGQLVTTENEDLWLFDQTNLPLMFDPERERDFATRYLAACASAQVVNLSKDVVVYKNATGLSVGIVRFKTGW